VEDVETGRTLSPEIYGRFRKLEEPPAHVVEAIFRGLGTRNLEDVSERLMDSYGLSKSRWSELFVRHSREILEGFLNRRLDDATYVAMFIDGKVIQGQHLLVAIGVTARGEKRPLGLAQASTENAGAITVMLREMIERGLGFDDGILIVIDGARGLRKAVEEVFGDHAVVQRCQIHTMRNVLDHLAERERPTWKKLLTDLHACEDYQEARRKATALIASLKSVNVSAARSLEEGLEETLTICRLNLVQHFKRAFCTTNIIESANSVIARRTRHITRWTTADQRRRWSALALLDFEESCNRIHNISRLPMLQNNIANDIQQRLHKHQTPSKASRCSTKKRT
jgi:transposase-like protein